MGIPPPGELLYNPVTAEQPLTPLQVLAGPMGLLAFLPLAPLVRLVARAKPRLALILGGLVWLGATLGPGTAAILVGSILAGSAWIVGLGALRRRGAIGRRAAIALVWIGLHLMALPQWWFPHGLHFGWGAGPNIPALHAIGLAYFLLRLVAWGVDLARDPHQPLRPVDTLCWLLYPPCMRLGPVLLRKEFLERFDAWRPDGQVDAKEVARHLGLLALGLLALGVLAVNMPRVAPGALDFFEAPQDYRTGELLRVVYLVPIQIYLILWSYNELAVALSIWVGIHVDSNFDWLPRATSVRDFWHRWHVTVGRWLRNYIYIPLGGNRGWAPLHCAAVFGYCAAWHGASWSFLVWGMSQALALTAQRWWDQLRERAGWKGRSAGILGTVLCWLVTMHYQLVTIVIFADFEHLGLRLFPELAGRLAGGAR